MSKKTNTTIIDTTTLTPALTLDDVLDMPEPTDDELLELLTDDSTAEPMHIDLDKPEPESIASTVPTTDVKAPKTSLQYDINAILAALPDTFTPATLDKCFSLNDGGKTVRRHLRKHFADPMTHNHNDKWGFIKTANVDILHYFASRYPFDASSLQSK